MRPGRDEDACVQVSVQVFVREVRGAGQHNLVLRRHQREHLNPRTIERKLDLVRLGQPFDVLVPVTHQASLNLVLAVERECVVDRRATSSAKRQPVDVVRLGPVSRHDDHTAAWRRHPATDRQSADFPRRCKIALHQGRRETAGIHVVKSEAGVVAWQQCRHIDVECQQVANRVLVLRAVEPAKRFGATGVGVGGGRTIERGLEVGHEAVVGRLIRSGPRTRRHRSGPELPDHLLPQIGVRGNVRDIGPFE